jgi:sec-independent protein translocase protein TatA
MGAFSAWHWIIVVVVIVLLFGGRGRISGLMADLGQGIKSLRDVHKDDA